MPLEQLVPNLHALALGPVNVFLLSDAEGVHLIDTGTPGSESAILAAIAELGKQPGDLRSIILTHCHPDHAGSAAALQRATNAPIYAPALEAAQVRAGHVELPPRPTPRPMQRIMFWLILRNATGDFPPAPVDHEIEAGAQLPIAGGLAAIAAPGHSAGQLVFLWRQNGGVLFVADTCGNVSTLDYSLVYDDFAVGQRTLAQISQLDFAIACFGHGKAIPENASAKFRRRWGKLTP